MTLGEKVIYKRFGQKIFLKQIILITISLYLKPSISINLHLLINHRTVRKMRWVEFSQFGLTPGIWGSF